MSDQLTREQAIAFAESRAWETMPIAERAAFQLHQDCLCMPFDEFHKAMEETLGRPIWTHEFASRDRLAAEMEGKAAAPSFDDILAMLPAEKTLIVGVKP